MYLFGVRDYWKVENNKNTAVHFDKIEKKFSRAEYLSMLILWQNFSDEMFSRGFSSSWNDTISTNN